MLIVSREDGNVHDPIKHACAAGEEGAPISKVSDAAGEAGPPVAPTVREGRSAGEEGRASALQEGAGPGQEGRPAGAELRFLATAPLARSACLVMCPARAPEHTPLAACLAPRVSVQGPALSPACIPSSQRVCPLIHQKAAVQSRAFDARIARADMVG